MKKLLIILVSFILIVSVGGCHMRDSKSEQEQLILIASSEEVKELIEEKLKSLDSNALTPQGKIREYEIILEDTEKNPMGGLYIRITVNNKKDYRMSFDFDVNPKTNNLEIVGRVTSPELVELLKE